VPVERESEQRESMLKTGASGSQRRVHAAEIVTT